MTNIENLGQYPESPAEHLNGLRDRFDMCAARLSVLAADAFISDPASAQQLANTFEYIEPVQGGEEYAATMNDFNMRDAFRNLQDDFASRFINGTHDNPEIPAVIAATDAAGHELSEALLSGQFFSPDVHEEFLEEKAEYDAERHAKRWAGDPENLYEGIMSFANQFSEQGSIRVASAFSNVFIRVLQMNRQIETLGGADPDTKRTLLQEMQRFSLQESHLSQAQLESLPVGTLNEPLGLDEDGNPVVNDVIRWRLALEEGNIDGNYVEVRDEIFDKQGCPAGNARLLEGTGYSQTAIEMLWPWSVEAVVTNMT